MFHRGRPFVYPYETFILDFSNECLICKIQRKALQLSPRHQWPRHSIFKILIAFEIFFSFWKKKKRDGVAPYLTQKSLIFHGYRLWFFDFCYLHHQVVNLHVQTAEVLFIFKSCCLVKQASELLCHSPSTKCKTCFISSFHRTT